MGLGYRLVFIVLAAGCGASPYDSGDGDYMDDDLPMGNCTGVAGCPSGTPPGSAPVGAPCSDADDCSEGAACMAPWSDGEVGDFTCAASCIPNDDESMWCLGSSACCDPAATCNPRGLCRVDAQVGGPGDDGGTLGGDTSDPTGGASGSDTDASSGSDGSAGEASTGGTTDGTSSTGG